MKRPAKYSSTSVYSRSMAFLHHDPERGRTTGYVETLWGVVGVMWFDVADEPSMLYLSCVQDGRAHRAELRVASGADRVIVREANAFAQARHLTSSASCR